VNEWLEVQRGGAPLVVSFPHSGTDIPPDVESHLISAWRARKDADWWVHQLYDFCAELGATTVRTTLSRTVIDVNRDPSGTSLYPNQATTDLCPLTTFDGEPLYQPGHEPDTDEIRRRREHFFAPYHAALAAELEHVRAREGIVVLYDAHSIRSHVPRLFDGLLPNFNIGTNHGLSCDPALTTAIEDVCGASDFSRVTNGRFRGGWITRHYGHPGLGVHAVQMELACRGYMHDPAGPVTPEDWPPPYDAERAEPLRLVLIEILNTCIAFAHLRARSAE
jgi:N-formylglutamate deformylase